jgi:hypothetical protein
MKKNIHDFRSFSMIYESGNSINLIIGDSATPIILKNSNSLDILGNSGSERTLWKSGMGVKWLKGAVSKYPVTPNVKNLVINIGTNGSFNSNDDIKGLVREIRRAFPSARLFVVQGSWGWGYNKNITPEKIRKYYEKFRNEGVNVIDPPIGNVKDPHVDLQVYKKIGNSIDRAISSGSDIQRDKTSLVGQQKKQITGSVIARSDDPYKYKVENDHWLAKKDDRSRWYEITGKDFKPAYQVSIDILDSENPNLRTIDAPKRSQKSETLNRSSVIPVEKGSDPKKLDPEVSEKYNFHLIQDNKQTNYRSAQFPLEIMKQIYPKYSITNVVRLNGEDIDGRHLKSDQSVSIADERKVCREIGCNFYDLSPKTDQDQVNEILSKGNTLIHCAHGADRTGGNVASYLYTKKPNPKLTTTEELWKYTTQYNDWNSLAIKKPNTFKEDVYLGQAKKFGVRDLKHAQNLAKKYK